MDWLAELPVSIVVCDRQGLITYVNNQAALDFQDYGGKDLVGKNVLACHPQPARQKLQELLVNQKVNIYTTEKNGVKKIVCQTPWYQNGKFGGLVELSFVLPADLPHFIR